MVYCVKAALAFSSLARRDAVLSDIETRIATRPRWDETIVAPAVFRFGVNGLTASMRFEARADADDLMSRVQSFATGQRAPLPGSSLVLHDCTHDEGSNNCTVVGRRDW